MPSASDETLTATRAAHQARLDSFPSDGKERCAQCGRLAPMWQLRGRNACRVCELANDSVFSDEHFDASGVADAAELA